MKILLPKLCKHLTFIPPHTQIHHSLSAFVYDTVSYPPPTTPHTVVHEVLLDQLLLYTLSQREICTEALHYHIMSCCIVCVCGRRHRFNPLLSHMGVLRGVDHAPGTIWPTFVVWCLLRCNLKWSLVLVYPTLLPKSRYRARMVRHLHTPPLGAPQLCHAHDIHLDQLLLCGISWSGIRSGAAPGCIWRACKSADLAHDCIKRYIHLPGCTMVGGKTRHMWLDKLCQKLEYCCQIYPSTSYTLRHIRWYLIHYRHLCVSHFHSHTSWGLSVKVDTYTLTNFVKNENIVTKSVQITSPTLVYAC